MDSNAYSGSFPDLDGLFASVIENASEKFVSSVDLVACLHEDSMKHSIRGLVKLPHGSGRASVRVAVFSSDQGVLDDAQNAGCDVVGYDSLLADIAKSKFDFDVLITDHSSVKALSSVARILGPKGIMPSPKTGTVVSNVAQAVADVKAGQMNFRADKFGNVHLKIGNISFASSNLASNFCTAIEAIRSACDKSKMKGEYISAVYVSSTMGSSYLVPKSFFELVVFSEG